MIDFSDELRTALQRVAEARSTLEAAETEVRRILERRASGNDR